MSQEYPLIAYETLGVVPIFSLEFILVLILSLTTTAIIIWRVVGNFWRIVRPSVFVPAFVNVFFQLPSLILLGPIVSSLSQAWWFLLVPQAVALSLLGYSIATSSLDLPAQTVTRPDLKVLEKLLPIALLALFAGLFFMRMPVHCTALFTMIFDPISTLLAREVTIKFAGSTLATASFGAVANTVAPVSFAISGWSAFLALKSGRIVSAVLWLCVIPVAVVLIMISGAKGLLLPTIIVCAATATLWTTTWLGRGAAVVATFLCIVVSLVTFELVRERSGGSIRYDLAGCAVELGACQQSRELLASMSKRGGLGLLPSEIESFDVRLQAQCSATDDQAIADILRMEPYIPQERSIIPGGFFARAARPFFHVLNRAVIVPLRVAAWHFLFVEQHGPPGVGALPLALKIFGHSTDMASRVYQEYGVVYSRGDRTSTSTSPVSFLMVYPAYFGFAGLAGAILLVLAFDGLISTLLRFVPPPAIAIAAGLMAVIGMNFVSSDFVTVMISHGGAIAVLLLAFYAGFGWWNRRIQEKGVRNASD